MPLHPTWTDIAIRLGLTFVFSGLIGVDRENRRHAAGLRTTILVGMAAAIAMIQANLLLPVDGKTASSFSVLDLMRLPLGILTGVGFIGGGAILKRGDIVSGVTTAATLWLTTVVGLCLGGGQLALGSAGAIIALATLYGLRWIEYRWARRSRAMVVVRVKKADPVNRLPETLAAFPCRAHLRQQTDDPDPGMKRFGYELEWRRSDQKDGPADLLEFVNDQFEVVSFEMIFEAMR